MYNLPIILEKLVITLISAYISFGVTGVNPLYIMLVSILVTIVNLMLGEMYVLNFGDIIASILSGMAGGFIFYFTGLLVMNINPSSGSLLIFAVILTLGELAFGQFSIATKRVGN